MSLTPEQKKQFIEFKEKYEADIKKYRKATRKFTIMTIVTCVLFMPIGFVLIYEGMNKPGAEGFPYELFGAVCLTFYVTMGIKAWKLYKKNRDEEKQSREGNGQG